MSVSSSASGSLGRDALRDALVQRLIEILAVGERGQRVGQALVAHRLEIDLELIDLLLGGLQALFQPRVVLFHVARGAHQRLDDRAQPVAVLGGAEALRRVREAFGVVRRRADRGVDHRHDLLDLVDDLAADIVDAVGEAGGREIGLVDLVDVGGGQRAVARERLVDGLIERRIVAGRVGVPDFVIARIGGLAQRLDLSERDLGERQRAFVLVGLPVIWLLLRSRARARDSTPVRVSPYGRITSGKREYIAGMNGR